MDLVQTIVLIFVVLEVHYAVPGESVLVKTRKQAPACLPKCVDISDTASCQTWKASGECERNSAWMIPNCKETCTGCSGCFDKNAGCATWAKGNETECINNPFWMLPNCEKSCGACLDINAACEDKSAQCAEWASQGHCDKKVVFMNRYCQKSCNLCECKDKSNICKELAFNGDCITNKECMDKYCPLSCDTCGGTCRNGIGKDAYDNNNDCKVYARCGYCENQAYKYHDMILERCPKSCAICGNDPTTTLTEPALCDDWLDAEKCETEKEKGNCDMPIYNNGCMKTCGGCAWLEKKKKEKIEGLCAFERCDGWAKEGYCEGDPCFMDKFCAPACHGGCQSYSKPVPATPATE